jgi:glutathione S-transferase
MKVYGDIYSGNCFKVRLVLDQLGIDYEWIAIDIMQSQTRTPEFLTKNPNGRVPLLELDDGRFLAESDAIIFYLASANLRKANSLSLLPPEEFARAQVLQWMFFEQYSHEPNIAVARYIKRYLGNPASEQARLNSKMLPGYKALDVMEHHLSSRTFFVNEAYSLADVALYGYTHVAHEGGFDMQRYPHIRRWLAEVAKLPNYRGMDA